MRRILIFLIALCIAAGPAWAGEIDLLQFARITATDTRETFLGLWPQETDDDDDAGDEHEDDDEAPTYDYDDSGDDDGCCG